MIPVGGVGGSVARQVVPKVAQKTLGRQFTTDIAASAIGSAIDGAVYGYGRGLMEGKNPTQTALEDSAFGFWAGAAVGSAIGKLVSKARAAETKGINQMRKYWGIPWRKASGNPELAIKTLMDHQRGFVPNVFNKQGIGNFDLPWGNSNFGLQHIIKRRNSQGINTENFVKNIPNIIKEGKSFNKKGHIDRVYLSNNIDEIAVRQNYKPENGSNIKRNWVTSTYRNYDKIKNPQADPVLLTSDTITQTNRIPLPDLGIKYNINDYLLKNNPAEWLNDKITTTGLAIKNLDTPTNVPAKEYSPLFKAGIEYNNTEAQEKIFTPDEIGKMSQQEFDTHEHAIRNQLQRGLITPQTKDFSGFKNPLSGNNKIYTREDIDNMSNDEYSNSEQEINAQLGTIGIPSNNELQNSSGAVYVEGYTRADGTKVKGYYRSR